MVSKPKTACKQEINPIQSLTCASPTESCIVCEESLVSGHYFALPTEYSELEKWAQGLFPRNPEDFQLFIDFIRVMNIGIEPYICSAHFAPDSIMGKYPLRLFPRSAPEQFEGSSGTRSNMMWQRKKCIVCPAQRPADEVYPFTQKTPLVEVWCNSMYPHDIHSAQRLLKKVIRAICPTLCGEHFTENCFNRARDLLPNSVPTMSKARTTSNVMDILNKAKADLEKVLPGNDIPRHDVWEEVDRAAGFGDGGNPRSKKLPTKKRSKKNVVQPLPRKPSVEMRADPFMNDQLLRDHNEESPLLFDSSQFVEEPKKEEEQIADLQGWTETFERSTLEEEPSTSTNARRIPLESEVYYEAAPPRRRPGRPRKNFPPPRVEIAQLEPGVTTRFGRQVKRKVIEDYAVAERRDKTKEGLAKAHRQFVRYQREKALDERDGGGSGQPRDKKARSRGSQLQMKVRCSRCGSATEATLHGMKEHAREHCEESLKCPFQPCDFVSTKRSRVSMHTSAEHSGWKLPIDLCETDKLLDHKIKLIMERCFPTAMKRANECGSVECTLCSSVVSPEYRSLYSHACLHLPSRPFHCSECPSFEAYTEEEIEDHLKEGKCRGDVVSNMDDAVIALVETLFKRAFPMYAHLLEDRYQLDDNIVHEGIEDRLPLFNSASNDSSDIGVEKKEEEELLELPHSSNSNHPTGEFCMDDYAGHGEWSEIIKNVDHDHQYTAPMTHHDPCLYRDVFNAATLNVHDIRKFEI